LKKTQEEWIAVFLITAAVYFIGAVSFLAFGSAENQNWSVKKSQVGVELKSQA
jgi:hypothetical protein